MNFQPMKREDETAFDRMIDKCPELYADYYGSEICFDTLWQWQDSERMQIFRGDHAMIVRGYDPELPDEHGRSYIFPFADSVQAFLDATARIVAEEGDGTVLTCLSDRMVELLRTVYPEAVISPWEELYEYVYRSGDLAAYPGKKYHAKRNFVNRFTESYRAEIRSFLPGDVEDVRTILRIWSEEKGEVLPEENRAIFRALEKRERLIIDLLYAEGKIEGILIGERVRDFLELMFFKCNAELDGIYPYFLNAFVKRHGDLPFVNMQEDMGIEGLRRSKQSYHPAFLQKKSILRLRRSEP